MTLEAAVRHAARPRIHTFLATSPIHMKYKLQMEPEKVLEQAVAAVKHARQFTDDVEFSLEDGSRSEPDFMYRIIEAVIAAGAEIELEPAESPALPVLCESFDPIEDGAEIWDEGADALIDRAQAIVPPRLPGPGASVTSTRN